MKWQALTSAAAREQPRSVDTITDDVSLPEELLKWCNRVESISATSTML